MHRTLCDFLADLYQNAVEAGARRVELRLEEDEDCFSMTVADNGRGMDGQELVRAQDPFYTDGVKHKKRRVGLGLPLVIQTLQMTDGRFRIESQKGQGTTVEAVFKIRHWDTPPLGDLPACLGQLMAYPGDYEVAVFRRLRVNGQDREYQVTRSELCEVLGDLEDLGALTLLREFFRSGEEELKQTEERT